MALDTLQYFFQRVPRLNYVSPPICEVEFSSSAFPTIILNPHARKLGPTGFEFFVQDGRIFLRWNNYPGAICFSIYKAVDELDPFGDYVLVAECVQSPFDIDSFGPGVYRVTAITLEGETGFSDPITVEGPGPDACIEIPGPLAPLGLTPFEIDAEVEWSVEDIRTADFYDDPAFPGGYAGFPGQFMFRDLPEDYPPGSYTLRYVLGFFDLGPQAPCGGGQNRYVNRPSGRLLVDNEWNGFSVGTSLADSLLWDSFQCGDPSFLGPVQAAMSADLAGKQAFVWNAHTNTGGGLRLVSGPAGSETAPYPPPNGQDEANFMPQLMLVQLDGLIQQPRGVRVVNWAVLFASFPSDVGSNWNGELPERTDYTQTTCVWTAAPNGAFGGATVSFSESVPGSPTGTGWLMEVFTAGAVLAWRGYKKYDETGVGTYFRSADSPTLTPLCLNIEEIP